MSRAAISAELRRRVAETARHRCGYCLTSQRVVGPLLEIDHIVPEAHGGSSEEENLFLACPMCNGHKSDKLSGVDPDTGEMVRLFHPRLDVWTDHFEWAEGGASILGKTPVGRATARSLQVNHPDMIAVRRLWVLAGWHPPKD